ncbi:FAD-dependent oxidoreductase [Microscilla marina]|uniref:Kynurenine 3-monooxygenase n=1 Tax=Microscilla marina ATCC 23134 TaxID=313606 RepID=A1ZJ28_MICM2|nr:NAD(P)/FAD-dependent oxidoreductase [Microscilla marina]EAY29564.1 kynurenine 3-monooxygenase [Microscilla marina ATCC 23134]
MDSNQKIIIVGAGLAGSLLSIYMARRGFQVEVYEKRPDMRKADISAGRSINLALSHRGIRALERANIAKKILADAIPMRGRMLHSIEGALTFVPYGKNDSEYINSISRGGLNIALMNIAESYDKVNFMFNEACESVDFEAGTIELKNAQSGESRQIKGEVIIGADGAGSAIRAAIDGCLKGQDGFQNNTEFLVHGYKELTIPSGEAGAFLIDKNSLHIWPRGSYMLIALPNLDGSFTCTLFFPNEGENSFATLDTPDKVKAFFETTFADAVPYLPELTQEFFDNPTGLLGTVRCYPWHFGGKAVLVGDAAHAIVPFYGQGMNASFEDCIAFDECLEKYGNEGWQKVFEEYQALRKANSDAIATLAVENFYEMRDGVADPAFLRKRQLERMLENKYDDYHSKYSMVTFNPAISYAEAHKRGNRQNEFLLEVCRKVDSVDELNVDEIYAQLKAALL